MGVFHRGWELVSQQRHGLSRHLLVTLLWSNVWYTISMQESIFMKIIRGDIPSHKIFEDDKVYAFLDIHPETPGHTLVIPKIQVDKIYDLPDDYYSAVWTVAKQVAKRLEEVNGERSIIKVIGTEVPHAHVKVMSIDPSFPESPLPPQASDEELAVIAEKLKL